MLAVGCKERLENFIHALWISLFRIFLSELQPLLSLRYFDSRGFTIGECSVLGGCLAMIVAANELA